MITIVVDEVRSDPSSRLSTIAIGSGLELETGRRVSFAGELRPMLAIAAAIEAGEEPVVELDDWQLLG